MCTYHDMTADINEQDDFSIIVYDAKCIALVLCNRLHEYYISVVELCYFSYSYFITMLPKPKSNMQLTPHHPNYMLRLNFGI